MNTPYKTKAGRPSAFLILCGTVVALAAAGTFLFAQTAGTTATVPAGPSVLVLYDNEGQYGWLGEIYSSKLQNLLGHFEARVTRKPLAQYAAGDLSKHDAAFYVAAVWNESPLAATLQNDIDATTRPFVWMGVNLWRYAWDLSTYAQKPAFEQKYGFRLLSYSGERHGSVVYKETELEKEQFDLGLMRYEITDPAKAVVRATCNDLNGTAWPYIIQSGNFWVVGDMPMISTSFENRSLAFQDLLHDMLGIFHEEKHRAFFRIEDVAPVGDLETLKQLGNVLDSLDVPFTISMIPEYRDWSGIYNNGVPEAVRFTASNPIAKEMKRWVGFGGQVLQHGTTHQIDGLLNPYNGVSGDDYEFYRVTADQFGFLTLIGPLPGETRSGTRSRVVRGQNILKNAGFTPTGWLTPHYLSSPLGYQVFAGLYPFACDRTILFVKDSAGKTQASELNSPYIFRDTYGLKRIPETIGYIDPFGWYELQPPSMPEDLIKRAKALKVVRDGWAGFYFHWYLDPELLRQTVQGLKGLGYEFTALNGELK
ncbi:MAG: DUF2334 domain-containing protein [Verrucomicrobia bacterium]|nr:DUF2334 domain-containing protein [Verrucomicrobiota bacterium]